MRTHLTGLAVIIALITAFVVAPATASAQPQTDATFDVVGSILNDTGDTVGSFEGQISDLQFVNQDGQLALTGVLNGTATVGDVVTTITDQAFTVLVDATQGDAGCQILFLDLGPIFLDLLGLQVDLSQIVLDVTAVPGAGNLLGNLLCAVAGLLDSPGNTTNAIANLLNRVLSILG